MANEEERIALFLDFENLALGARDRHVELKMAVIMDALSERGRIVIRRAYADWNLFADYRQDLVGQRIEMIEIPQRTGMVRKNAADIKLAVDALVRARCEKADISPEAVTTRGELEVVLTGAFAGTLQEEAYRLLRGWRRDLAGAAVLDLARGRIGLRVVDKPPYVEETDG